MDFVITRSTFTFAQTLPRQTGMAFDFLAGVEYTVDVYYENGTLAESRDILLAENVTIASFGWIEVPIEPRLTQVDLDPEVNDWFLVGLLALIFGGATVGLVAYVRKLKQKRDTREVPARLRNSPLR